MKIPAWHHSALCAVAALVAVARAQGQSPAASPPVQLPAYEVTAPPFTSNLQEFFEKMDNLFDAPWIDASRSGPLIEAIIWRHQYLAVHPGERAIVYIDRRDHDVEAATTVYTDGTGLYANSYALGERVRLHGLSSADIGDREKVGKAIGMIRDSYLLLAEDRLDRIANFPGEFGRLPSGVLGAYTVPTWYGNLTNVSTVAPFGIRGGLGVYPTVFSPYQTRGDEFFASFFLGPREIDYHQPGLVMIDAVYRTLHDPNQAGIVPVAVSRVNLSGPGRRGRTESVLAFDWDGIHYLYRPYRGTIGYPIPRNPVTGLPYLCVRDSGFLESVYFCATYTKAHPGERATVVAGPVPSAAYTFQGHVCIFSPGLNQFAQMKRLPSAAIDQPEALVASIKRLQSAVARLPQARKQPTVPQGLKGDTPDLQMRRAFLAFSDAGLAPHLKSTASASSLTFAWQGKTYVYGPDLKVSLLASD